MRVTDTDVIIVGAGPAGLMLAAELCLAGVRPLILERQPRPRETPKASGFNGQIVELLRYRGLLDRIEAASAVITNDFFLAKDFNRISVRIIRDHRDDAR